MGARRPSGSNKTLVIILIIAAVAVAGIALLGIVAAIAVPGLMRARMSGNEASAIAALRAIISGQASYAASCAAGGYAVTLDDLARPRAAQPTGFVSPDLNTNGVVKGGYRITLSRDVAPGTTDVGSASGTCNGSTRTPASSYFATAEPVTPGSTGTRYFATDARGTIFWSTHPIPNPIGPGATPIE